MKTKYKSAFIKQFSQRLTKLINERKLSRYKIAKDTKITQATLSNYFNGKVKPNPSKVKQLSDYLNVEYGWLMFGEDDNSTIQIETNKAAESKKNYKSRRRKSSVEEADPLILISTIEERMSQMDEELKKLNSAIEKQLTSSSKK